MICGSHVPTSPSLVKQFPPEHLANIMPCEPICVSVCLVLCLLRAHASPQSHPNPSSHSWVSPYPFMSAHTYMSFLGNFPAIHGRESCPVSPFVSLAVLFSCAFVSLYPTAPIKTHMHRYAPVHTRPRPRLHWDMCNYVNLIKSMLFKNLFFDIFIIILGLWHAICHSVHV